MAASFGAGVIVGVDEVTGLPLLTEKAFQKEGAVFIISALVGQAHEAAQLFLKAGVPENSVFSFTHPDQVRLNSKAPILLITDYSLPGTGLDGLEVLAVIATYNRRLSK